MKTLIFGATGLIGSELCKALEGRGHQILRADLRHGPSWREALPQMEAVINLGGSPLFSKRWNDKVKAEIHSSRVQGTQEIVAAMGEAKAQGAPLQVFINASAIGFYGPTIDEESKEGSPNGNGFLAFVCREWEAAAWVAEQRYGIRSVFIRTGIVLGQNGGALKQMLPPFKAFIGGSLGTGRQWMSWIHIDDVVALYIHALENSQIHGALNATAPHPLRNKEFSKILAHVLHRPCLFPVPSLGVYALFGEVAEILVQGQKVLPELALKSGFKFKYSDLEEALRNLL